jgi:hypothetical protein
MCGVIVLAAGAAPAAAQTWDGGSVTDGNWATGNNWNTNVAPGSSPTASVTFAGTTRLFTNQNIATPFLLTNLQFNAGAGAFSLSGLPIEFRGSSSLTQLATNTITINNEIRLGSTSLNIVGGSASQITLNGPITGTGTVTTTANLLPSLDRDLARINAAWPTLPEPIRRAVLALVATTLPAAAEAPARPRENLVWATAKSAKRARTAD